MLYYTYGNKGYLLITTLVSTLNLPPFIKKGYLGVT